MRKKLKMTNLEMIEHLNGLNNVVENFNGATQYAISRTKDNLNREYKKFDKARNEAKKSYCELDEAGELKINKDKTDHVYLEGKEDAWKKVQDEMLKEEAVIEVHTIKTDDVFSRDISPKSMDGLLFILETEDAAEDKPKDKKGAK